MIMQLVFSMSSYNILNNIIIMPWFVVVLFDGLTFVSRKLKVNFVFKKNLKIKWGRNKEITGQK